MVTANAQLENSNWIFGEGSHLNFQNNGLPLTVSPISGYGPSFEGSASVSDEFGQLLLYTDSNTVWNGNGNIIAEGLSGSTSSTQGAIIIKRPGTCNRYFIITAPSMGSPSYGYFYTEIDTSLNNGIGGVIGTQNMTLFNDGEGHSEKLTSYTNSTLSFTWVVFQHKTNFYAYKIDENGINLSNPVISPVMNHINSTNYRGAGSMKISPDGTKLAISYTYLSFSELQLLPFNANTGTVTTYEPDARIIASNLGDIYGVEFSPNSNLIYFTNFENLFQLKTNNKNLTQKKKPIPELNGHSELYQYEIGHKTSLVLLGSSSPTSTAYIENARFSGIQRAVDNKIYVTNSNNGPIINNSLSVIEYPNNPGNDPQTGCGLIYDAIATNSNPWHGLPQWVYKSGLKESASWALNFGSQFNFKAMQDIATDDEGNIYVLAGKLASQSAEVTTALGNNDFVTTNAFVAKFNSCNELIAHQNLGGLVQYGATQGEIKVANGKVHVIFSTHYNDTNFFQLNTDSLAIDWGQNVSGQPQESALNIDSVTGNYFMPLINGLTDINGLQITSTHPTITKINNDGEIQDYQEFNLGANITGTFHRVVSHNDTLFIAGYLSSTSIQTATFGSLPGINIDILSNTGTSYYTYFILKATYSSGTYTPVAIEKTGSLRPGKIIFNPSTNKLYSSHITVEQPPLSTFNRLTNISSYDGNTLGLLNQLVDLPVSDIECNLNGDGVLVSFYANSNDPTYNTYLKKYSDDLGTVLWQADEVLTGNNHMSDIKIATFENQIYLTGEYVADAELTNTKLKTTSTSIANYPDVFALRIKDHGSSFEFKTAAVKNSLLTVMKTSEVSVFGKNSKTKLFKVFPNPFQNSINIRANTTDAKMYSVTISNLLGTQQINKRYNTITEDKATINTSNLSKGIYSITISDNDTIVYQGKLIK